MKSAFLEWKERLGKDIIEITKIADRETPDQVAGGEDETLPPR